MSLTWRTATGPLNMGPPLLTAWPLAAAVGTLAWSVQRPEWDVRGDRVDGQAPETAVAAAGVTLPTST
jgi:hypothetical protein